MRRLLTVLAMVLLTRQVGMTAQLLPMSVETLTREATYVIEGRVLSVRSEWNFDRTQIYSYVSVAISRSSKLEFPLPVLELRLLGGEIPEEDIGMDVTELPKFVENTDVVVFLAANPQMLTPVIGGTQGLYVVSADPATGRTMAVPQEGRPLTKDELDRQIQQALSR